MTQTLQGIPLQTISGETTSLGAYRGKVALVVNVASKCGLTPQYEALEGLYQAHRESGFVVLGFPANDFAGQEPSADAEILAFCRTTFDVQFPMFAKIAVTGPDRHPLYSALIAECPVAATNPGSEFRSMLKGHGIVATEPPEVLWNFEKFLIGKDGRVVGRFAPDVAPDDPMIARAIAAALNA